MNTAHVEGFDLLSQTLLDDATRRAGTFLKGSLATARITRALESVGYTKELRATAHQLHTRVLKAKLAKTPEEARAQREVQIELLLWVERWTILARTLFTTEADLVMLDLPLSRPKVRRSVAMSAAPQLASGEAPPGCH